MIQIGTSAVDAYGELLSDDGDAALLGVDKDDRDLSIDGFMPVVFAESGTESYLEDPYVQPQKIIVHDQNKYQLEKYISPNYLYWISTWVQAVTSKPEDFDASSINTPEELAWAISIVNGENGETAAPHTAFTLTGDIDMSANIWVPIGSETSNYAGQFEGNGHVVTGLKSSIGKTNQGMFGVTDDATIQNMVVNAAFNSSSDYVGAVIGTMKGGTLSNVEGAGSLENMYNNGVTGGLVGVTHEGATIHSTFVVPTIKGGKTAGGLVGINAGDLYNSYANVSMSEATNMGGLVSQNDGHIENCYVVVDSQTFPAFAATNNGTIRYCYADKENYVSTTGDEATLTGHGTYGAVIDDIKHILPSLSGHEQVP